MMKVEKWNNILISLLLLLNTGCLINLILSGNKSRIMVTVSLYFIIWVPKLIRHFLKVTIPSSMELVYIIFLFFASFLGSVVNLYSKTYWYDSFVHFISGILTSVLAIIVLFWFHKYDEKSILFNIFFMVAFSLMVASLWEFFEFTSDQIFHGDTQKVLKTGVVDTMKDMIVAFLGAILTSIYYGYEKSVGKKYFFYHYEKEFGCTHD